MHKTIKEKIDEQKYRTATEMDWDDLRKLELMTASLDEFIPEILERAKTEEDEKIITEFYDYIIKLQEELEVHREAKL